MGYKEDYKDVRDAFLSFKKEKYFELFSSADLFLVIDHFDKRGLFTFIDHFYGDVFGLQCFFNRDGINYVHDLLSVGKDNVVTIGDCDSIVGVFKKKEDLNHEDIEFLTRMGYKKTKDTNLIIYRFEKGYRCRLAKNKEIALFSLYAVFLKSLIENEKEDILESFRNENSVVASVDFEVGEYHVMYRPLPYLEENPRRHKANMPFVLEYENHSYLNEDCYLFTSYLPVSIKETEVRPLLLYFYFANSDIMQLKYILDRPKDYKDCIYGILDDVFSSIGMPAKMIINNRDLYFIISKTLDQLHIENTFERNSLIAGDAVENLNESIYSQTLDGEMEAKETVKLLMETISNALNSNEFDEFEKEDKEDNFVS